MGQKGFALIVILAIAAFLLGSTVFSVSYFRAKQPKETTTTTPVPTRITEQQGQTEAPTSTLLPSSSPSIKPVSTPTATPTLKPTIKATPTSTSTLTWQTVGSNNTSYALGVLVIKYFPINSNGNIDIKVTGDVGDSYQTIRNQTISVTNNLKSDLEKMSRYLGFKDSSATPSLSYSIVNTTEHQEAVPLDSSNRKPLYKDIMLSHNICDYVENKNVREVWLWAYQGPNYPGTNYPYLNISESKMAGPQGDISNSPRLGDMPVCKKTYIVYTFNYGRGTAEALESWGHQLEAELSAVDSNLFRNLFQGIAHPQTSGQTGRCGSVHNPPNARFEYDRANPNSQKSDCLDWNPDGTGNLSDISCKNWTCKDTGDDNDNASRMYEVWYWQNLPGKNNTKTYQGKQLRNWWDIHADFDSVMRNSRKLTL